MGRKVGFVATIAILLRRTQITEISASTFNMSENSRNLRVFSV